MSKALPLSLRDDRRRRVTETARPACWLLLSFAVACSTSGCGTTGIRASRLPNEFRAAKRESSKLVDFAQVASPGIKESLIGPRDLLKITVSTGRDGEKPEPIMLRVAQNGAIDVPLIGPTQVAGLETHQAGPAIAQTAIDRQIYIRPYVTVEMESKAVRSITVLGAVKEPGVHELPYGNSNLVSALAAAGGLTEEAGTRVEIIRQPSIASASGTRFAEDTRGDGDVQLAAYQSRGAGTQPGQMRVMKLDLAQGQLQQQADTRLIDRDIVKVVPRKEEMVFVSGLVTKPGQYELPIDQDMHLLDAIAIAGGKSSPVADEISIIRHVENREQPVVIKAKISRAKRNGMENLRLASGDTVIIEQTPATVVVDTFRQLFRMSFGVASEAITF